MRGAGMLMVAVSLSLFSQSMAIGQSLDELHKGALKEGASINFYSSLAATNAMKILTIFEKRFPGIKVNHVDATVDQLAARVITEARAGKTLADVYQAQLANIAQLQAQGLFLDKVPAEAIAYPEELKGSYWVASDMIFIVAAWNTNLVNKREEPKDFEGFGDEHWKNRLMVEPRDEEFLAALAKYKYKDDDKAIAFLKRIAANNVEFHNGHSQLAELVVAGQGAVCLTCYAHHFPPRMKKGAPVNYILSEGVGDVNGTAILKNAPHPNGAWLFARWIASEEGQKAYAMGGRSPAHPKVQPLENTRPAKIYPISAATIEELPKYEKIWKEIFRLR
jgi:iron(III) transport system substrate-binding protein